MSMRKLLLTLKKKQHTKPVKKRSKKSHEIPFSPPKLWKRIGKNGIIPGLCGGLFYLIYLTKNNQSEAVRLGVTGSLTLLASEMSFYFVDTINMRSKVLNSNKGGIEMLREIVWNEGPQGLYKGIQACFFGSIIYGFSYFYIYKKLKEHYKQYIGKSSFVMFML